MSKKKEIINIFEENWTSVFNTILGREVRIAIDTVTKTKVSELEKVLGNFQSFVGLSYGEEENQHLVIALRNRMVSIISNLMIGLDTFKDEITADDKDAFEEAVNQMFSACQVPIKEALDLDMKFKNIAFIESADTAAVMGPVDLELWKCVIQLPEVGQENFVIAAPRSFGAVEEEKPAESRVESQKGRPAAAPGAAAAAETPAREYDYGGTNIDLLMDVELPITVRIGTTEMRLIDIMRLGLGSIIELEKMVDDPVEILVNDKLVARGEVVVCDSNFAVRITEVESKAERIKSLA